MEAFHFSCPHCSSRLRVRDPLSLGRPVDCPECRHPLKITEGKTGLVVEPVAALETAIGSGNPSKRGTEPAAGAVQNPALTTPAERKTSAPARGISHAIHPKESVSSQPEPRGLSAGTWWRRRPAMIAAALCCAAIVLGLASLAVMGPPPRSNLESNNGPITPEVSAPPGADPRIAVDDEHAAAAATQTAQRLERLGAGLEDQLATEGAFPAATYSAPHLPVAARLSWQAVLADQFEASHPPPVWDRPWNDPLNDAFVRRRLLEFQNPAITALTGADGYPAAHFVGVAGVGDDAAKLDASDPRAGIFGDERQTRLTDVRDGLSNTWLVLGVRGQLGSWAAGGRPTARPLTRDPIVNGPDGFGTGRADSMLVLLADGRVQTVSALADPRVLRALATINDGEPLPVGERPSPHDADSEAVNSSVEALVAGTGDEGDSNDPPLAPQFAPEPARKEIDLTAALQQPILLFDEPNDRRVADLLPTMAEMAGAPIRFDPVELGIAVDGLKTKVHLRLENTTVGEILENLLKPAGLAYRVERRHIQIVPSGETN